MLHSRDKGFTLIELLVVIAVIGLLASIVLVALSPARQKAQDARRISDFVQIKLALELFYDQTERYPQSPGAPTWSGHWAYFSECLEQGTNCGFTISNYTPVISKVPQDPLRTTADPFAADVTYYPGYPTGCSDGQSYRLAVQLETNNSVLDTDLDGSFYNNNGKCEDANRWYCVGVSTCNGW